MSARRSWRRLPGSKAAHDRWRRRVATFAGGLLIGLVALAFARAADTAQALFGRIAGPWPYATLMFTPALFALSAWVTTRFYPTASGSGIPQVIAAAKRPEPAVLAGLVSLPIAVVKFVVTLVMLLAGASVGREGPTVQITAALNIAVHRWLRVPVTSGVIIAGGAAGVAAAFNTPLAGVAFAIEELASAYEQRVAVLVMLAVMIAGFISLGLAGNYVYLGAMEHGLPVSTALLATPVAGVAGGLLGGLFSRALLFALRPGRSPFHRLRRRPVLLAASCGLIVAAIGVASAGVTFGTGYQATRLLVEGTQQPWWFGPARFVATLATAASGTVGGIFAPSLSVGAGLGNLISALFPHAPVGPIVLLGMIGYFTGVVRAPLTAVIIVSEATAAQPLIIPLFATAIIADGAAALVCREKLYEGLARPFLRHRAPGPSAPASARTPDPA